VDRRALIRLRIAFLLLAAALLVPLGLLVRSVDARLEAQRRLRHELVAERIFDEMERELTALLQHENARPSAAYADTGTRVENWAPFVVGYFTRDARDAQIIAKPQLAPERVKRLEAALEIGKRPRPPAAASTSESAPSEAPGGELGATDRSGGAMDIGIRARRDQAAPAASAPAAAARGVAYEIEPAFQGEARKSLSPVPAAAPAAAVPQRLGTAGKATKAVPEAVLMQLNRASEVREQERQRPRQPTKRKAEAAETPAHDDPLSGY
jgi:hypothetical protein